MKKKVDDDGCDLCSVPPISPSSHAFLRSWVVGPFLEPPDDRNRWNKVSRNFAIIPYVIGGLERELDKVDSVGTRYQALTLGTEIDFTATVCRGPDVTGGTSLKEPGR